MKTIFKYPIHGVPGDSIIIGMPAGARVVHFGVQNDCPFIWAEVFHPNKVLRPTVGRVFMVVGTGQLIPDSFTVHHGTAFAGPFVWHLYEDKGPNPS